MVGNLLQTTNLTNYEWRKYGKEARTSEKRRGKAEDSEALEQGRH